MALSVPASESVHRRAAVGFALAAAMIVLLAGAKAVLYDSIDPDCFLHLLAADQMTRDGIGPLVDGQSYMSVRTPWTPYSWLAEFGMKFVWDYGGYRAAVAIHAMMAAGLITFVALACMTRAAQNSADGNGVYFRAILAVAFATFLTLAFLSFRPVTAAMLIMALCVWLLVRDRAAGERTRAVWFVIPLTALLINLHLYAIIIPAWFLALWAGSAWELWRCDLSEQLQAQRRMRRYTVLLIASCMACLVTPMLPGVIRSIVFYQSSDAMVSGPAVAEYLPFYSGTAGKISATLVLIGLAFTVARIKELRVGEIFWLLGSIVLLMRMGRFSPVFAMAAAPIFAAVLPRMSDRVLTRPVTSFACALIVAVGLIRVMAAFPRADVTLDSWMNRHGPETPGYPALAAAFVEHNIQPRTGRLINEYTWGGYLSWRLGSRYQVLLDGRTNLFTPEFWRDCYLAPPLQRESFLRTVDADAAVLPVKGSLFRDALETQGWKTLYADERSVVLVPSGAPIAQLDAD